MASFVFKEILVLMHPFIPFVTEEIWLKNKLDYSGKNYLMLSNWITGNIKKDSQRIKFNQKYIFDTKKKLVIIQELISLIQKF